MPDIGTDEMTEMRNFLRQRQAPSGLQSNAMTVAGETAAPAQDTSLVGQARALAGSVQETMSALQNRPPLAVTMQGNVSWFDRNQRKDEQGRVIPIDMNQGIDLKEYSRMVWQRRPEERIAVLRKMFPGQVVRLADTGEPIVEVLEPGGTRHDVMINPPGFNAQDLLEVGSSAPEMIGGATGSTLGAAGGTALLGPAGGFAGRILGGAAGVAVGGAIKDVTARQAEGLPVNFSEIERTRSDEAEVNALFDFGLSAGAKGLRVFSPFAGEKGPLQFNLIKAKEWFKREHGMDYPITPGEQVGNKLLLRLEATEAPQPGASTIIGGIQTEGEQKLTKLLNRAVGARVPEEELGRDVISELRQKTVKPVEDIVKSARDDLVKKGETELVGLIDSMTGVGSTTKREAGEAARTAFAAERKVRQARKDAAYAAVKQIPGGTGKTLPADSIVQAAQDIIDELPKYLETEEKIVQGQYGPFTRRVVKEKVMPSGRPEGLQTFLTDMKKLKGQKMSLEELDNLKNAANNAIAATEAVAGAKDRWFTKVAVAYDKAVTEGAEALGQKAGNTDLKDAILHARDVYKKEMLPLDREGLHDILRQANEPGFQSPEQIVNRLFTGSRAEHNYRALQETLGPTSTAFAKIKRSVLEGWINDASDKLTHRISPDKVEELFTALSSSKGGHPEIYKDIVGSQEQALFTVTRSLKAAGKEIADLDPDELSHLIRAGSVTRDNVLKLAAAQRLRDTTFVNPILKQLASDGVLDPDVSPIKFVRALSNADVDTKFVQQALSRLQPAQLEQLKTAKLYEILSKAGEYKTEYMPLYLEGEPVPMPVSAKGIVKAMGKSGSPERARNEMLLGPNHKELIDNVIMLLGPREVKQGKFGQAGSMAVTGTLGYLLKKPFLYAEQYAKKLLVAATYTSDLGQSILTNEMASPAKTAALANMLVASEPFLRKVRDVVGDDAAYSVISDLKRSIDKFVIQDANVPQEQTQMEEMRQFLQTRRGSVKMGVKP